MSNWTCIQVCETRDGKLTPGTLSAVTFARQAVGPEGEVDLFLTSESPPSSVPQINRIVLSKYTSSVAEILTKAVVSLVRKDERRYGWITGDGGSFGKNVMPRIAGCVDVMGVGDVVGLENVEGNKEQGKRNVKDWIYRRFVYAGAAIESVKIRKEDLGVFTVRGTGFEPAKVVGKWEGEVEMVEGGEEEDGEVRVVKEDQRGDGVELGSARVVIAGGRGLKKKEHFRMLDKLASKFEDAAVGATRAAVDDGWCPNDMQVGQTGKIVAPQLYIGLGLSGAIQHLAGMKESKCIVAVNKDKKAPIFQVADYGIVGDVFDIVPKLTEKIEKR